MWVGAVSLLQKTNLSEDEIWNKSYPEFMRLVNFINDNRKDKVLRFVYQYSDVEELEDELERIQIEEKELMRG